MCLSDSLSDPGFCVGNADPGVPAVSEKELPTRLRRIRNLSRIRLGDPKFLTRPAARRVVAPYESTSHLANESRLAHNNKAAAFRCRLK